MNLLNETFILGHFDFISPRACCYGCHSFHQVSYERLAYDLVGPLTRTKTCYKFIMTVICSISTVSLDATTVAEGLMDVAHTGVPKELLTDQGTVFTGKVMKETCRLINSLS